MKKKTNISDKYKQLAIDFGDNIVPAETVEELEPEEKGVKGFDVGAVVIVKPEAKHFCDGRGIPDYARKAYIKRLNPVNKTVVIETEPNGKELGLLFMSDVVLA